MGWIDGVLAAMIATVFLVIAVYLIYCHKHGNDVERKDTEKSRSWMQQKDRAGIKKTKREIITEIMELLQQLADMPDEPNDERMVSQLSEQLSEIIVKQFDEEHRERLIERLIEQLENRRMTKLVKEYFQDN